MVKEITKALLSILNPSLKRFSVGSMVEQLRTLVNNLPSQKGSMAASVSSDNSWLFMKISIPKSNGLASQQNQDLTQLQYATALSLSSTGVRVQSFPTSG